MKYWEIIANNLSKAGWSWGCVSAVDSCGRTIWIADAHRGDGPITIGRFKSVEAVPTVLQFFAPGVSSVQSGHMVSLGKLRANVPEFASWTISNASSNEYRPASARRFVYP
jgi:hypothetical protein